MSPLQVPFRATEPGLEAFGPKRVWSSGRLRGWAWAEIPGELSARVQVWLEHGPTAELEALKLGGVYRCGPLVVKFFWRRAPLDWVRPSKALRAAELYFRCLPIPSPRPLLAVGGWGAKVSLLLREHVEGRLLSQVWHTEEGARNALAPFLAHMARCRVLHGDLHPMNLIWTEQGWWLLDVAGMRHRLHPPGRILAGQWARLIAHLGDEPGLERAYREFLALSGRSRERGEWPKIRAEAQRLALRLRRPGSTPESA